MISVIITLRGGLLPQRVQVERRRRGASGGDVARQLQQLGDLVHLALSGLGAPLGQPVTGEGGGEEGDAIRKGD